MAEALFIYGHDKNSNNCDIDKNFLSFYFFALVSDYNSISRVVFYIKFHCNYRLKSIC